VSDADLEAAFHLIDTDSSGSVALEEVISFAVGRTDWSGCRSE
jgi:Ca2+-binding EF-hand superfamily protein